MNPFCRTAAATIGSGGRLPFFTHQSATQISIWALSSSSCHTPSITKSTSCLLKHHLGRGDGGGVELQSQPRNYLLPEASSDNAVKAAPQGLFSRQVYVGWGAPLVSLIPPPFSTLP